MSRPAKPQTAQFPAALNAEDLATGTQALDVLDARSTEIAERFGDGLPYARDRVVHEARFFMGQSAEAMLEAGRRLIQLKENEPHGDFMDILEGQLQLAPRTARQMMQAAVKYLSPRLESKRRALAVLGKAKLLDLMVESDDDIEALAQGGTMVGHTLDDVSSMSSRELKKALKDARADIEAKDRLIETKNAKIDKLSTYKRTDKSLARDLEEQKQLDDLHKQTAAAEVVLMALGNVVSVVHVNQNKALRVRAVQAVQYLVSHLAALIDEHSIDVDLSAHIDARPEWLGALNAGDAAATA